MTWRIRAAVVVLWVAVMAMCGMWFVSHDITQAAPAEAWPELLIIGALWAALLLATCEFRVARRAVENEKSRRFFRRD